MHQFLEPNRITITWQFKQCVFIKEFKHQVRNIRRYSKIAKGGNRKMPFLPLFSTVESKRRNEVVVWIGVNSGRFLFVFFFSLRKKKMVHLLSAFLSDVIYARHLRTRRAFHERENNKSMISLKVASQQ